MNAKKIPSLRFLLVASLSASALLAQPRTNVPGSNIKELTLAAETATALRSFTSAEVAAASDDGSPTFLSGNFGLLQKEARKLVAKDFEPLLQRLAPVYRLRASDIKISKITEDDLGMTHAVYTQEKNGLPVIGTRLAVHVDRSGKVYAVSGNVKDSASVASFPKVSVENAKAKIRQHFSKRLAETKRERLVYLVSTFDQRMYLAHEVAVLGMEEDSTPIDALVYVDAETGDIVDSHSQIMPALNRTVRTANFDNNVSGTIVRSEGSGATGYPVYDKNYDYLGYTHAFYASLGRDSVNGAGLGLDSTTDFRNFPQGPTNNAYWSGSLNKLVFGDGDGTVYKNWALALDLAAHEFTHGVTQYTSGLIYSNEPGGINEAISDIMGAAVGAANPAHDPQIFWFAENLLVSGSGALRYMNNPIADLYSKDYYPERVSLTPGTVPAGSNDYGHVHGNSGIANLAFYLLCQGGQHPRQGQYSSAAGGNIPNTNLASIGMSHAQAIFYRANAVYLGPGAQFMDLRQATVQSAQDLYGGTDASRVSTAWDIVGVPAFVNRNPVNISARAHVGTGDNVLIAGFVMSGGGSAKTMLVRGLGPKLASLGVTGALANPRINLYQGATNIGSNDDWSSSSNASTIASLGTAVGAQTLANPSLDAAIIPSLNSGGFTAVVEGVSGGTGIGLVEVYDTNFSNSNHLVNISARAAIGTGDNVLIAGFVITGSGNKTMLIRGLGPKLGSLGVSGYLADPQIQLYQSGSPIRYNNNWTYNENSQNVSFETANVGTKVGAQSLSANSNDSALLVTLPAGVYSVVMSGVSSTTGVGLLEVYEVN